MDTECAMTTPVDMLATRLGVPKSDFDPHFQNDTDWIAAILEHWGRAVTKELVTDPEIRGLPPIERLTRIAGIMMGSDLARYEPVVVQWALQDETASRAIHKTNHVRLACVRAAFADAGFDGDDLETRSRMFTCYVAHAAAMLQDVPRKQLFGLIAKQVEILVSQ